MTTKTSDPLTPGSRLAWLDLLKGLGIFLVVLGHTASPFGVWIYSFHMPLFFFASAIGLRLDAGLPLRAFAIKRFKTLILPFFLYSLLLIACDTVLSRFGVSFGCAGNVRNLFVHLSTPENAGATWFLVVLAEASILLAVSRKLLAGKSIFASFAGLVVAAVLFGSKITLPWSLDLGLLAWFILDLSYGLKPAFLRFQPATAKSVALLIAAIATTYVLCFIHWAPMNWPTRAFDRVILLNLVSAFAGIYTLAFVAKCLERAPGALLKPWVWLGQNSIGILMFHFIGFKVGFLVLGADSYSKLVPGPGDFWLTYLGFGLGVSALLTLFLARFTFTRRYLLGKY